MRVESIVHRLCKPVVEAVHAARVGAVVAASTAVIWAGRLSVSRIGRALRGPTSPKHSIKRIDRLLSNQRLWLERTAFFRALASLVVADQPTPKVLVDWTKLMGDLHALVAAVPVGGRAVPIYSEVHPERRLGSPRVQARFLRQLATVLPAGCRPIIVADAGFKTPFFVAVRALGWHFVIRLRGRLSPRDPEARITTPLRSMFGWASEVPLDLGIWQLASRERSATSAGSSSLVAHAVVDGRTDVDLTGPVSERQPKVPRSPGSWRRRSTTRLRAPSSTSTLPACK
jgi:hypothetical protein